jgi:hypothetical protein
MGQKTLPMIWGTYMKLVTKYQISAINSCWEKCNVKLAYMFNVYKNQQSRQTGSRNLMGPKTLPTIWYTYMTLVTKCQISAINSYWEKCNEKYLGWTEGRTDVKQYTPSPFGKWGYKNKCMKNKNFRKLKYVSGNPQNAGFCTIYPTASGGHGGPQTLGLNFSASLRSPFSTCFLWKVWKCWKSCKWLGYYIIDLVVLMASNYKSNTILELVKILSHIRDGIYITLIVVTDSNSSFDSI